MPNTDFVVDRIRSRLGEMNTAKLQSEKLFYFYEVMNLCPLYSIAEQVILHYFATVILSDDVMIKLCAVGIMFMV